MRTGRAGWSRWGACGVCGMLLSLALGGWAAEAPADAPPAETPPPTAAPEAAKSFPHPFGGPAFTDFVDTSSRITHLSTVGEFYAWMDHACLRAAQTVSGGHPGRDWAEVLERQRNDLDAVKDPDERARAEILLGVWLHGTIKRAIPNYNLFRGFELSNVAGREERQCMLQSVLISSLLQAMGVDAGIAMVNRNRDGVYTNNTHVIVLLKLPTGHDAIVDASYREPLVAHQGLMAMLSDGSCRYVRPVYSAGYREIVAYTDVGTDRPLSVASVRPMDPRFIRSQFNYFRGERTPGGLLTKKLTAAGLDRSVRLYEASLSDCPKNPLPSYMLGQVYEKQGRDEKARAQYEKARDLYSQAGWIPNEVIRAVHRMQVAPDKRPATASRR